MVAVIIISGYPSVGKTTVAKVVAQHLKLGYMGGGEALMAMAIRKGYKPSGEDWWDTAEGMAFLRERSGNSQFDKDVDNELLEAVDKGNMVVTSYTLPWLAKKGWKFWLSASAENRARRMSGRDRISYEDAVKVVRTRDEENRNLYSKLYGFEFGYDLSVFDFVVSTDRLSKEQTVESVLCIAKRLV
ncbi:MAG: cytidylate kinase family protein [Thaumarchaeota archaeon]|nr:cytidylate kinase family protein [Nitrososphaerota archaeon]